MANSILEAINALSGIKSKATLKLLVDLTKRFDKGKRLADSSTVRIVKIGLEPYVGTKFLRIHSITDNNHEQVIDCYAISFDNRATEESPFKVSSGNKIIYASKIDYDTTPVAVICSCNDYRFTFAYWNKNRLNALTYGKLKAYQRKTLDRPSRNPDEIPGLCKHLLRLVHSLTEGNILK